MIPIDDDNDNENDNADYNVNVNEEEPGRKKIKSFLHPRKFSKA